MSVTIQVQVVGATQLAEQLTAAPDLLKVETGKAMTESLGVAEAAIKDLTPRKTGRLFSAWKPRMVEVGGQWVGHLGDNVSYAPYVEEGTRAHDIVAHGNALMIPVARGGGFGGGRLSGAPRSGQQVAFYRSVHHPGTRGVHMATEGLNKAKPEIQRLFLAALNRVLVTIKGAL